LQNSPSEIHKLTRFRQALDDVPQLGIEVLAVERHILPLAPLPQGGKGRRQAAAKSRTVI
jgi:hypothetical protein